jgi:enoyl-CoA hydratase/carnithine racemase
MARCGYEIGNKGVAVFKFNNPPMNAIDEDTMLEMEKSINMIAADEKVKVIVVTGEGGLFIVGADVNSVRDVKTHQAAVDITTRAQGILNLIEKSRKPYIAAINGLCLGGGMELAMACHMRIAGDQVQMGLPEIRLGIIPAFGGTQRSARLLGPARALEIMLTGKFITMKEAEKIGLVNMVVPQAEVLSEALKLAESIASKGQVAVRAIMEAVMDGVRMPLEDGLRLESNCFGRVAESEDKEEGIAAFLEKRKPQFKDK